MEAETLGCSVARVQLFFQVDSNLKCNALPPRSIYLKFFSPGPKWFPFFGCNGIISSRMGKYGSQWKVISEMAKEHSTNILGLKLGGELVVVVFGEKNIRQVATEKEFDARPDSFFLRLRTFGKRVGESRTSINVTY